MRYYGWRSEVSGQEVEVKLWGWKRKWRSGSGNGGVELETLEAQLCWRFVIVKMELELWDLNYGGNGGVVGEEAELCNWQRICGRRSRIVDMKKELWKWKWNWNWKWNLETGSGIVGLEVEL